MQRLAHAQPLHSGLQSRSASAFHLARSVLSLTRVDILWLLAEGPMPVGSIAEALDLDSSSVSHALAVLRREKLVVSAVDRWKKHYRLTPNVRADFSDGRRTLTVTSENGGIEIRFSEPDPRQPPRPPEAGSRPSA